MKFSNQISRAVLISMVFLLAAPVWSSQPPPTELNTTRLGGLNPGSSTFDVVVRGDYAYLANLSVDLLIIDISDPQAPVEVGRCDTCGDSYGVFVSGDYAYTVAQSYGLFIIDVSDPTAPTRVGQYPIDGSARRVFVDGDYAYVAVWDEGLRIIDVSDPTAPNEAGYFDAGSYDTFDVHVSGHFAHLVGSGGKLHIVDVMDPATPTEVATLSTDGYGVFVEGHIAYIAGGFSDLHVVDVSHPATPVLMGTFNADGNARDVVVSGDYAFVAQQTAGLRIVDVSDPALPLEVGYYVTDSSAFGVSVSGNLAYVAGVSGGLNIIRNNLDCPGITDCDDDGIPDCTVILNNPVSDWNNDGIPDSCQPGTSNIPSGVTGFALYDAQPNPFNPLTTIAFDLPQPAKASLRVYDVNGRLVRTLLNDETANQGRNEIVWNGCDDAGREVPSGVYFFSLEAGSFTESKKAALLK